MKTSVFILAVSLVQVLLSAKDVNPCVEDAICAYEYYGNNMQKTVSRCTCPNSFKCVQQEDDLDLSAHIFRCKIKPLDEHEMTCVKDAICAYKYFGNNTIKTVPRCTCPDSNKCIQQEIDLDLSAHIFRCKPKPALRFESFCNKEDICAYGYLGDNIENQPRCRCPTNHKCVKQEFDLDLSVYIFRCKLKAAPGAVNLCDDNAICAYGFYGESSEKTVFNHKLSR